VSDISIIQEIIADDPVQWRILETVRSLNLPDCWIGAGFVRNAVWDYLHGRSSPSISTDVDVIWFDTERRSPDEDTTLEIALRSLDPTVTWSVKNQARMHAQNGDQLRIPRHPATQPTNIRPPVPHSSGQAVGAQRRRFVFLV
jgi:hypothetical protein